MAFDLNDAEALGWQLTARKGGYEFSGHSSEFLPRIEHLEEQTGAQIHAYNLQALRRDHEQIDRLLNRRAGLAREYVSASTGYEKRRDSNHPEAMRQLDTAATTLASMTETLTQFQAISPKSLKSHERFMAFMAVTQEETQLREALSDAGNGGA